MGRCGGDASFLKELDVRGGDGWSCAVCAVVVKGDSWVRSSCGCLWLAGRKGRCSCILPFKLLLQERDKEERQARKLGEWKPEVSS
jgi:hypothetical protein